MKSVLNYKNAVSYFSLIGVFSIILFSFLIISYVGPTSSIKSDIDFGKASKDVDLINYKLAAQDFFIRQEIDRSLNNAKFDFIKSYGMSTEDQLKVADANCIYNKVPLWYNEKNIAFVREEGKNTENNDEKNINENIVEASMCIPNFKQDSKKELESHINQVLSEDLKKDLSPLKTKYSPKVEISNDKNEKLKVNIIVGFEETGKISNIKKTTTYTYYYDISSYSILLESISSSLPSISLNVKDEVPLCTKEIQNDILIENKELECIKRSSVELIKENFIKLGGNEENFNNYEFEISDIKLTEDSELKGFYAFKLSVNNKNTKNNELEFGVILKDNIPSSVITFNVEQFSRADNTIKVKIFEPKESLDINSYIVLYSFQDFFNEQSYLGYSSLIEMLKSNQVPKDFEQSGFYDDGGTYYFSKPESNLNLNLLVVNKNNFGEDEDSKLKYKNVNLYQIYNFQEKKWELLENKQLYVYVFATDDNKNYYVKDLSGKALMVIPQKVFGPFPLSNDNDPSTVDTITEPKQVLDVSNSFSFEITGYDDSSFDHYDIYILKNRDGKELKDKCIGVEFENCKYYDGKGKLTQKNGKFLVTSNSNEQSKETFENKISLDFNLETGVESEVLVAPVDISGKAILSSQFKEFGFRFVNTHYALEEEKQRLEPKYFKVTLKDNVKPNPLTSINLLSNTLNLVDGKFYLQWNKIDSDVTGVYVRYEAKDSDGNLKKQDNVLVGIDGFIFENNPLFASIVISKIIPVDSSGNKEDIMTYSGPTHSATYP